MHKTRLGADNGTLQVVEFLEVRRSLMDLEFRFWSMRNSYVGVHAVLCLAGIKVKGI